MFLVLAAVGIGIYQVANQPEDEPPPPPEITVVRGYYGGEKQAFLENPAVLEILRDRYQLELDPIRRGSIEMVLYPASEYENMDFVWPSNEVSVWLYEERNGNVSDETIFRSPIVLFSWQPVVDALIAEGIVEQRNNTFYVVNMTALVDLILSDSTWADIGVPELGNSSIRVVSSDPTRSNSGNMFYSLLMNLLSQKVAGEEVATTATLPLILPTVENYYQRQGLMPDSSGVMFEQYVTTGMGANPIVAGYENQLIEFYLANPDLRQILESDTRILYPEPTVWSSHPIIPLTEGGQRLTEALQDQEIQTIAWQQHGFRSENLSINDPATLDFDNGVPQNITRVVNLPRPSVVQAMLTALEQLR